MDDSNNNQDNDQTEKITVEGGTENTDNLNDDAKILLGLDELIKTNISTLERLKTELKQQREMLNDSFANNPTFREHLEKVKEANKVKSQTRQQILKQPSVINISNKVKSISSEVKEREAALSDYLLEYQRLAGVNQIEGLDGEVREIVNTAKLIKRSSKK